VRLRDPGRSAGRGALPRRDRDLDRGVIASGERHETRNVDDAVKQRFTSKTPEKLIGDRAFDSVPLEEDLADQGIELIAPKRSTSHKRKQDL
jgi:hypothetical protein